MSGMFQLPQIGDNKETTVYSKKGKPTDQMSQGSTTRPRGSRYQRMQRAVAADMKGQTTQRPRREAKRTAPVEATIKRTEAAPGAEAEENIAEAEK